MEEEKREEINETGSIELTHNNRKHNIQLLTIIGEIEGHEAVSSSVGAAAGTSCAGRSVPSCVRRPMEANSSSSSMPSVFTFLLPMLTAV